MLKREERALGSENRAPEHFKTYEKTGKQNKGHLPEGKIFKK